MPNWLIEKLRLHNMILRAPEDGGGAADSGNDAPPPGDAEGGSANDSAPPSDLPPQGRNEIYRPDGLPDHMLGQSDRETIDKMAKALSGYRQKDTDRGVPADPAAYSTFGDDVPEALAPHIKGLSDDTAFQRVAKIAHERGIPVGDFQSLTTELYAVAQEMGVLEPFLDVDAEREALTPENARDLSPAEQQQARERRMQENESFLDQLASREAGREGGVSKEVFDYVKTELGDSAKGHMFIEYVRRLAGGDTSTGPFGGGANGGGADPRAELARKAALPENTPGNPKFDRASYDQLQKEYERVVGN
ncbi:hypothetical protein H1W37_19460 [Stappia taiwanensis]|uniref:Uncharacterized protein n=1 Tax=Stappia taiwanensis TaxID=992267 RepID=A0A838XXQ2_9HYPH|nr:hypothetical protein [Stappia taiwanensis]MBA4613841.1 hypothetical protein [Stappia taiwanensis]GGE79120.1 hypothetical protein GCM10007285_03670 [Stappia taiwanensis]